MTVSSCMMFNWVQHIAVFAVDSSLGMSSFGNGLIIVTCQ